MSKINAKWVNLKSENMEADGNDVSIKFSDADTADANKVWSSDKVNTISGVLSAEIDSDISTHSASDDHDGRYYTETEIDNFDFLLTTEMTTISGDISTEIDADISTHEAGDSHDSRYYTETELDAGQLDDRYYTETEVDTISGTLNDKIAAVGGIDEVEYITVDATDISNKYTSLSHTPYSAPDVMLDIIGGGTQVYTTDFTVIDSTHLNWDGLGIDGVIAADDKIRVSYTYTA